MATAISVSSFSRLTEIRSPSGRRMTMPSARPRGMMVALWIGSLAGENQATTACPAS